MKLVIVNENNREKIESALDEAQKRCRSNILYFSDIVKFVEETEETLKDMGLKKKYWNGVWARYYPTTILPKRYQYHNNYKETTFGITYTKGSWKINLDTITREETGTVYGNSRKGCVKLTDEQQKIVTEILLDRYTTI